MVIKKKSITLTEKEFIEKGSVIASEQEKSPWTTICLRIPKKMVMNIDKQVKNQIGFTRTGWILKELQKAIENSQ